MSRGEELLSALKKKDRHDPATVPANESSSDKAVGRFIRYGKISPAFSWQDALILLVLAGIVYGVVSLASLWTSDFRPKVEIDLSVMALPKYAFFSTSRAMIAYFMSLAFALVYGYAAARVQYAERTLILLLDILQSIPVLGFLPGLVLGLISLFPKSNVGVELSAIILIFSCQVWNLCFSFYASLRSVPQDLMDVSHVTGLNWWQRLLRLELPFSAVGLVWNSLLSMAGGWFFITVCESFSLGERSFRLPGLGSYMAVAIERGDHAAMISGVIAMTLVILLMDVVIWRPVLVWVQRFRFDEHPQSLDYGQSFFLKLFQKSRILDAFQRWTGRFIFQNARRLRMPLPAGKPGFDAPEGKSLSDALSTTPSLEFFRKTLSNQTRFVKKGSRLVSVASNYWPRNQTVFLGLLMAIGIYGLFRMGVLLHSLSPKFWFLLLRDTFWSCLRVAGSLILATVVAVPVGIVIGLSPRTTRFAQPIIQVVAAFPSPMLYPLVLSALFYLGIGLDIGSMVLMTMGSVWYVLFNVLAGAMGIPGDLRAVMEMASTRKWTHWRKLYLPSIFPSFVIGIMTAAGSNWNAVIVTEYLRVAGSTYRINGLGATISRAAEEGNFSALAGSLLMMIGIVVLLNRTLWYRLSQLVERRFQLER